MKSFCITSFLLITLTYLICAPILQGQESVDVLAGAKSSGLQVRIRECPEADQQDGKTMMIFEVQNTSDRPVEFCWWQSPLEKSWTANRFKITGSEEKVDYLGAMVKRRPPSKSNGDYTTLRAGWTLGVEFDLREAYQLKPGSKYSIRYEGTSLGSLPPSNLIEIKVD